jgi:hypothetical protein
MQRVEWSLLVGIRKLRAWVLLNRHDLPCQGRLRDLKGMARDEDTVPREDIAGVEAVAGSAR